MSDNFSSSPIASLADWQAYEPPRNIARQLLVVGNGFDIACGLPSRFVDFFDERVKALGPACVLCGDDLVSFCRQNGLTAWDLVLASRHATPCGFMKANWCDIESAIATVVLDRDVALIAKLCLDVRPITAYGIASYLELIDRAALQGANSEYEAYEPDEALEAGFAFEDDFHMTPVEQFEGATARVASFISAAYPTGEWDENAALQALLAELHLLEKAFAAYMVAVCEDNSAYQENSEGLLGKLICYDLPDEADCDNEATVLNFNYTTPAIPDIAQCPITDCINIHGVASDEVVIGIDGKDLTSDSESIRFAKTYRLFGLRAEGVHRPVAYKRDPFVRFGATETWTIKFYGHSLAAADYSYFQSIFDMVDLYNSDVKLYFRFSNYEAGVKEREFLRVAGLLSAYGKTLDNKDHGKNLTHKLLLEGRLSPLLQFSLRVAERYAF